MFSLHLFRKFKLPVVLIAVLLVAIGYGVTFPLLAIRLDAMQISPAFIGLNAAMPALGWVILTPLLPRLHRKFSSKMLMLGFLAIALLGLYGFTMTDDFALWLGFRLAFGGGLGLFFRVVEYWLNTVTHRHNRGRVIGIYSVCFLLGIATGSVMQPALGTDGIRVFGYIGAMIMLGAVFIMLVPLDRTATQSGRSSFTFLRNVTVAAPLAMAGVVAYGLFEDVPAYLLSIYTLQVGLAENIAAYTLSAFAIGNLLLAIPIGIISDKIGRQRIMFMCGFAGLLGAIIIPVSLGNTAIYLAIIALWGGFIGGLYVTSLAYIGDHFSDDALIAANAAFGTVYAGAAVLGPLANGMAMHLWTPHGLMVACAIIFGGFLVFAFFLTSKEGVNAAPQAD